MEAANKDLEHLKLLSISHYIVAGFLALFACVFIIHIIIGVAMLVVPEKMLDEAGNQAPAFIGWIFAIMGGAVVLGGWIFSACMIAAGRFLARKKHHLYCLIIAGISCLFVPLGTVLGIFTLVVLLRPEVKQLFASANLKTGSIAN